MKNVTKLAILFTLLLSFGCKKEETEPTPPVITFLEANLSKSGASSTVKFDFFDLDGDLGLLQEENNGEQEYNVFIDYYEKNNGVWELKSPVITYNITEEKFDTVELHLRFPFLENDAKRTLEGEVSLDLLFDFNADTIKYELFIKDRAYHKSNIITTSEIIIN